MKKEQQVTRTHRWQALGRSSRPSGEFMQSVGIPLRTERAAVGQAVRLAAQSSSQRRQPQMCADTLSIPASAEPRTRGTLTFRIDAVPRGSAVAKKNNISSRRLAMIMTRRIGRRGGGARGRTARGGSQDNRRWVRREVRPSLGRACARQVLGDERHRIRRQHMRRQWRGQRRQHAGRLRRVLCGRRQRVAAVGRQLRPLVVLHLETTHVHPLRLRALALSR